MNKTYLKKYRAKRIATDLSIRKHVREKQGRMKRAARAGTGADISARSIATDLLAGDFVSPGGAAFQRATASENRP